MKVIVSKINVNTSTFKRVVKKNTLHYEMPVNARVYELLVSDRTATVVVVWVHGATRQPRAADEPSVLQCTHYARASVDRVSPSSDRCTIVLSLCVISVIEYYHPSTVHGSVWVGSHLKMGRIRSGVRSIMYCCFNLYVARSLVSNAMKSLTAVFWSF